MSELRKSDPNKGRRKAPSRGFGLAFPDETNKLPRMRNILTFLFRLPLFLAGIATFTIIGVPILFVLGTGYLVIKICSLIIISPLLVLGVAIKKELKHLGEYFGNMDELLSGPKQCLELLRTIYISMFNWVLAA